MNPIWALLFKDRIRTPFSVYKMSFAEVVFLLVGVSSIGYGLAKGVSWVINSETPVETVLEIK